MFSNIIVIKSNINFIYIILTGTYLISGLTLNQSLQNLASYKSALQSSTWTTFAADKAVDGRINTYAHGNQEPTKLNWWKVDLKLAYYISKVILTPRQDFNEAGRMDYLFIGISNSPNISGDVKYPVYPLCRQSPYKVQNIFNKYQNISVNCRPNTPPGQYVFIQQPTTSPGYLTIAEVQVYGIQLEGNTSCQGNYYGDKCDKYCNCDKGVKCDQQGICPNGCDVNWKGDHCHKRKDDVNQYLGCFQFTNASNYTFIRMNSQSCIVTCSGYGFTFAANMTSDQCICTNTMNWTQYCQNDCPTDSCQKFYSVCPNGTYGFNCTLKCNCFNNESCSYMEGHCNYGCTDGWTGDSCNTRVCPNGTYGYDCILKCYCFNNENCSYVEGHCNNGCAEGWSGDSCNIRNCSNNNGNCEGNSTCVSNATDVSSCQCNEGYIRTDHGCERLEDMKAKNEMEQSKSAIIGGVIGTILGLVLIAALLALFFKLRKTENTNNSLSLILAKPSRHIATTNRLTILPKRTFKLPEILQFIERNALNYVDEFRSLVPTEDNDLKYLKNLKDVNQMNRFKNIAPYEHNRVKLIRKSDDKKSDYINASFMEGIIEDVLIAAQGPVKKSVDDFWKMILQQNIGIIIMLCNYVENKKTKCEQYLPETNSSFKAGEHTIQHHKTISWPSFKMTELNVIYNDQKRSLIHLHYTEWPDHGVPNNVFYLLDFWRRCQKLYESYTCGVMVHCSAGIGRTGSFLAISDLLVKGYQGLDLSVPATVNNLRKQRMKMVEKQAQYNFIYEALIEEVKLGQTSFFKDEFTKFYNQLKDESNDRFIYQYQVLSKFCSNRDDKKEINKSIKVITSSYNFSLITNKTNLITWQNIPETQCIFIFDSPMIEKLIPKVDQPITNGQICISLVDERISEWGRIFEVQLKNESISSYENVVVETYENINSRRDKNMLIFLIDKKEDYLDFLTFMELYSKFPNDADATIILGNNPKLGYFFVAACNIISQLKVYDEVAILQNVCELCKVTDYQPSQISFEMFHQIVHDFILTSG